MKGMIAQMQKSDLNRLPSHAVTTLPKIFTAQNRSTNRKKASRWLKLAEGYLAQLELQGNKRASLTWRRDTSRSVSRS